jgi:alanine racemase
MQVHTELVAVREIPAGTSVGYGATWTAKRTSRIATIPMGYADGLSRALSNRGELLVRGKRAPIAGVVSMDMAMLDVTEIDDVRIGDECVVLGTQKGPLGQDIISAEEIAGRLGTIPWEVLTDISRRVPRFYREP